MYWVLFFPQVKAIRQSSKSKADTATSVAGQVRDATEQVQRQTARVKEMEELLQQRHAQSQRASTELMQKTTARNDLAEDRKERWRVLEGLQVWVLHEKICIFVEFLGVQVLDVFG